jgi:hypothetical protein
MAMIQEINRNMTFQRVQEGNLKCSHKLNSELAAGHLLITNAGPLLVTIKKNKKIEKTAGKEAGAHAELQPTKQ